MSNTLGGFYLDAISQETLSFLKDSFPLASTFTTNFTGDIATKGQSVTTRIAQPITASEWSPVTGYAHADVESVERSVSLDKHIFRSFAFNDMEVAKGGWPMLQQTFMQPLVHSIIKKIMDDTLATVTAANFGAPIVAAVSAADFDADKIVEINNALTKENIPNPRLLTIGPDYYAALQNDTTVRNAFAYNSLSLTDGDIPRLFGLGIQTYNAIPENGENLVGFVGGKEGILMVARVPEVPSEYPGAVSNATDPESGLTLQLRMHYNPELGVKKVIGTLLFGVGVGNEKMLRRIVKPA